MTYADRLAAMFRDYFNDYLTVERFAEHNDLTLAEAGKLIKLGREISERQRAEWHQQQQDI